MKVPKDVAEDLQKTAEAMGIPMEKVKEDLKKKVDAPFLASLDEEERVRQAAAIIKAAYASELSSAGEDYDGIFFQIGKPRTIQIKDKADPTKTRPTKVANAYGIFSKKGSDDDPTLASISFWDEACKTIEDEDIEVDKPYRVKLGGQMKNGKWDLTTNKPIIPKDIDIDLPPLKDVIENIFTVVPLSEAEFNVSAGFGDHKMVRGRVMEVRSSLTKKGDRVLAFYSIMDDSIDLRDFKDDPTKAMFKVMIDDDKATFDCGSDLYFIGNINTSEQYGPGMFADAIIPILGVPRETQSHLLETMDEAMEKVGTSDAIDLSDEEF